MSIPTLMIFKNGELASRQVGAAPKQKLEQWITLHRGLIRRMRIFCTRRPAESRPLRYASAWSSSWRAKPPFPPMEALSVDDIPAGPEWQYEPKWDGFRCLVFRDGDKVELQSKSGQPLTRYYPESSPRRWRSRRSGSCSTARSWCRRARRSRSTRCCSASIRRQPDARSWRETPALLIVFDLLADEDGTR